MQVTTAKVGMSAIDIRQALLNEGGILHRCGHCGCVSETYRDSYGDRQRRKIGEYDSCASPNRFTISQSVLDEYMCLKQNGRLAVLAVSL